MENPTGRMLREIYKEAKSGCETICCITSKIRDKRWITETARQMEMYADCTARAEQMLQDKELGEATFSMRDRLSVRGGVLLETMDATEQALTDLLQISFRDSAVRMRNTVARFAERECDADALALGQRLAAFEAAEAERLRQMSCE